VFLGRDQEVEWFLHGMQAIFPEAHAAFTGYVNENERGDVLAAYLRRLTDPDPSVHLPAARAWSVYEGTCSTLLPSPETVTGFSQDRTALGLARIEAYYPGRDRAGPLRHDLPGDNGVRARRGLAERSDDDRAGRGSLGAGAGDPACPGRRGGPLPGGAVGRLLAGDPQGAEADDEEHDDRRDEPEDLHFGHSSILPRRSLAIACKPRPRMSQSSANIDQYLVCGSVIW
jgi:hypothetical protein